MKATLDVKPLLELGAGLRVIDADAAETAIVLAVAKGLVWTNELEIVIEARESTEAECSCQQASSCLP